MSTKMNAGTRGVPDHLVRFPCMMPWVGCNYDSTRLLIVGESHYLPNCITDLHHDKNVEAWYETTCQSDVPNCIIHDDGGGVVVRAHSYMDTKATVDHHSNVKSQPTYTKVESATGYRFRDFAFFNYIFRPVEKCARNYWHPDFDIGDRDRDVAREIMEWFICAKKPQRIIMASGCVRRFGGTDYLQNEYPGIRVLSTSHPNGKGFMRDTRDFLLSSD